MRLIKKVYKERTALFVLDENDGSYLFTYVKIKLNDPQRCESYKCAHQVVSCTMIITSESLWMLLHSWIEIKSRSTQRTQTPQRL